MTGRAALRVLWGTGARTKYVLAPNCRLLVGRDDDCDLVLARDAEVSGRHFSIEWDGERGMLRDEKSRRGTEVGGIVVDGEIPLHQRSWIRAGATDLMFEIEIAPREVPPHLRGPSDTLRALARQGCLWAIVDASRGDAVVKLLRSSMDAGRSLYEGLQGDVLVDVAPHLVHFSPDSRLLDALVVEGWSAGFALYIESGEDERTLRRHFRRFLVVQAEGIGPRTYFRFYDPMVFAPFWDMATPRQRADLSRGIDAFWIPDGAHDLRRIAGAISAAEDLLKTTTEE